MPLLHLGDSNHRPGSRWGDKPVSIRQADRLHHLYIIGRTGTGKSTLLGNLLRQDLSAGAGCAVLDPHGDLVDALADYARAVRAHDLTYLDFTFSDAITLNPFEGVPPDRRPLAAAAFVNAFKKLWADDWGPRLEHLLRNVFYTLLEVPGATLGDAPSLLTERKARDRALTHVENEEVRSFWRDEYAGYSPAFRAVVAAPLQNKLGALLTDPRMRRIFTGQESSFDVRQVMDQKGVLLVNLSKGQLGEGPSGLLGSLLVSEIAQAALERADTPPTERTPFFLYLDEFQTFPTLHLATMASELRKYGVGLTLAHQHLSQLAPQVRDAVLANAGTLVAFRLGAHDARYLAPEFASVFTPEDLLSLPNHHVYLRLMIDGEISRPFSATTVR